MADDTYTAASGGSVYAGWPRPPANVDLAGSAAAASAASGLLPGLHALAGAAAAGASAGGVLAGSEAVGLPVNAYAAGSSAAAVVTYGQAFRPGAVPMGSALAGKQLNVLNRWPDNSAKFGVVSALVSGSTAYSDALVAGSAFSTWTGDLTVADLVNASKGNLTSASFDAGAWGSATFGTTELQAPFEAWVSGPLMSSWVYRLPFGSDAHLVAWMEVRLYRTATSGYAVEVLPWVENGYLTVASPGSRSATYTFALNGSQRFSESINLLHHQRTPLLSGSALSHWLGSDPGIVVVHDTDYIQSTGLVPSYFAKPAASAASVTSLPTSFAPLANCSWPATTLEGVGYHAHLGLLPQWDVVCLTAPSATTWRALHYNGFAIGSFGIHYREDPTAAVGDRYRPARLGARPTFQISVDAPAASGGDGRYWSITHGASAGLAAYLATGRRYFLDEVQFCAGWTALGYSKSTRENGKGIVKPADGGGRAVAWAHRALVQAIAATPDADSTRVADYRAQWKENVDWYHARNIGPGNNPDAPIGSPQGFIEGGVDYNSGPFIFWAPAGAASTTTSVVINSGPGNRIYDAANGQFDGWSISLPSSPGAPRTITSWNATTKTATLASALPNAPIAGEQVAFEDGVYFDSTWMQDMVTAVWGYAADLALGLDASTAAAFSRLYQWKAKSIVGRLGFTGSTEYLYRDFGPYTIATAASDNPNWDPGAGPLGPFFATWRDVYDATYGGQTPSDQSPITPYLSPGPFVEGPLRSYLNPEWSPAIAVGAAAYAVKHGIAGAEAGWQRLTTAANWADFEALMDAQPAWAIAPRAMPAWWRGLAVNQWVEIIGSSMVPTAANVRQVFGTNGVAPGSGNNYSQRLDGYCGATLDTRRSTIWVLAGGGHGDYYGNEVLCLDLRADAPVWEFRHHGSSGNIVNVTTPPAPDRYSDGLPASRHTYQQQVFIPRHGRALSCGGSLSHFGNVTSTVEAWNVETALNGSGWDATGVYPASTGALAALPAATTCADPCTDVVYTFSGTRLHKLTPTAAGPNGSANSGAAYSYVSLTWDGAYQYQEGAAAMDTRRGHLLITHCYGAWPYTVDPATGAATLRSYSGSGAGAVNAVSNSCGIVYIPHIDRYLLKPAPAGGAVYSIDAETFAAALLSTTGGAGIPAQASSGSTGASPPNGVYNKWQFAPALRGVVYLPGAAWNAWFLRTH